MALNQKTEYAQSDPTMHMVITGTPYWQVNGLRQSVDNTILHLIVLVYKGEPFLAPFNHN